MLQSINPLNNTLIARYDFMSDDEIIENIEGAHRAFALWRTQSFTDRAVCFNKVAILLRERSHEGAELMAIEMGKPLAQGIGEMEKCASCCEHFAAEAASMLAPQHIASEYQTSYVAFQPLGVVFAIMPWNFPFWQVFRAIAPAMMAGNTIILKHSPEVTGCALMIQELIHSAGFPKGIFTTLRASIVQAAKVISHPIISGVTFTGSTRAGKQIASIAGAHLKKTVLELGGSDAYIILEDADVESAAQICVNSRIINSGQSCVAAKRFIVVDAVRTQFEDCFVEAMKKKTVGDPFEASTNIGPLARVDLRDNLQRQTNESIALGARVLLEGGSANIGAFFNPVVLSDVRKGTAAYDEELFGPVGAIIPVRNEDEAIRVANDCVYGLGSAVFSSDAMRGERVALALEAGVCFVNDFVKSDPRFPFGGVKDSGWGRELSAFGIREFVNIKTLCVR